jgi:hypothetical protein
MHPLLKRQLRRFIGEHSADADTLPVPWRDFVVAVGQAYEACAAERELNERSMLLASQDL